MYCGNYLCPHLFKSFEQLKKDFPFFHCENVQQLQREICTLCQREMTPKIGVKFFVQIAY